MHRLSRVVLSVLSLVVMVGCVHTSVTRLGSEAFAPTSPAEVQVFRTKDQIGKGFKEIGLIRASADADMTDQNQMVEEMKKKAAEIGGQGLILGSFADPTLADRVADAVADTGVYRQGEVVVIRFTE